MTDIAKGENMEFTTKEVVRLTKLPSAALTRWVQKGIVTPETLGAPGRGLSCLYTLNQAMALAMIAALRASPQGCWDACVKIFFDGYGRKDSRLLLNVMEGRKAVRTPLANLRFGGTDEPEDTYNPWPEASTWDDVEKRVRRVYQEFKKRTTPATAPPVPSIPSGGGSLSAKR